MGVRPVRSGCGCFREVEWRQIVKIGVVNTLRQFGEDVAPPCQRLDAASPACQHQAVGDGAGSLDGVAEQPTFSAGGKDSDVAFQTEVHQG